MGVECEKKWILKRIQEIFYEFQWIPFRIQEFITIIEGFWYGVMSNGGAVPPELKSSTSYYGVIRTFQFPKCY